MDPLDFAIYRYLSPEGTARFWAGRRMIDPRITPRAIAERVGLSESGVRSRLQHLARRGFLRDQAVVPNPSLFGRRMFVTDLSVGDSAEVDHILRDIGLVDGVVFTRDILDEDERKVQAHFVCEDQTSAARLGALLGRLSAKSAQAVPRPYYIPRCARELTPLDWRVLHFVRREPGASFADLRDAVGISLKTAARCYHHLLDSRACWWSHGPESEEFPLALVRVDLEGANHRDPVLEWLEGSAHGWMPVAEDGFGLEPGAAPNSLAGLVPADVPTALERFLRKLSAVEGVAKTRRTFALGSSMFPSWFTDHIAAARFAAERPRLGPRVRRPGRRGREVPP